MNGYLKAFRVAIWIGIAINMVFALPALFAPGILSAMLGLPHQIDYPWLNNTGMLLVGISMFYVPAGINPLRFPLYSWLCAASRLIAVVFWFYMIQTTHQPDIYIPMLFSDGAMFVILSVLLMLGMPPEYKLGAMLKRGAEGLSKSMRVWLSSTTHRIGLGVALVLLVFVGYQVWANLLRVVPTADYESPEEHFKYAAIGLGPQVRVPYYLFAVMPDLFPDKLPDGWETVGLTYEAGKDVPVGFAQRQIGYKTVEANCALCHTGRYRAAPDDTATVVPTAPANTLDLERFQWILYDAAADPSFTPANIMAAINKRFELGLSERFFYRFVIIPVAKMGLLEQRRQYAWQKLRPTQGPGRTDTFNPTKIVVFGFPDDSTIGTTDLPQIWNQRPREGMWLHWDGNNDAIKERNYAAAMAVGATPESVLTESFKRVTDWLLDHPSPPYPFSIDQELAAQGKATWDAHCAGCHDFGKVDTGQVTVEIDDLGTDPHRLNSFTTGLVDAFHEFKKPPFDFGAYRKTQSYSNTPTDGIWMRGPYLHNGSVPTLWDLLTPPQGRPVTFYRGSDVFDERRVGFASDQAAGGFLFDTRIQGNHNGGHVYGTDLGDAEKWALIEYMKTL